MEITVNIVDRNYEQIKEFCDFNNIAIEDYIVQCVEDDYFTRKYGDLNDKINKSKVSEKEEPIKKEEKKAKVNKVVTPNKKVENNEVINGVKEVEASSIKPEPFIKEKKNIDTTDVELQKIEKRIKRTLKVN